MCIDGFGPHDCLIAELACYNFFIKRMTSSLRHYGYRAGPQFTVRNCARRGLPLPEMLERIAKKVDPFFRNGRFSWRGKSLSLSNNIYNTHTRKQTETYTHNQALPSLSLSPSATLQPSHYLSFSFFLIRTSYVWLQIITHENDSLLPDKADIMYPALSLSLSLSLSLHWPSFPLLFFCHSSVSLFSSSGFSFYLFIRRTLKKSACIDI